jgi:creatinine amidohydrolase
MPGVFLDRLTWSEAQAAFELSKTVVLPVGAACKEHGPHLPLNTDFLIAEYLARRIAEFCPVVIAPTVSYGYYPAFLEYPGSASISARTFCDLIVDICRSFAGQGVRQFFILNTGISTLGPLTEAQTILSSESIVMRFTDLHQLSAAVRREVEQQPYGTHADEIETSIMLYCCPEVVKLDLARSELASDAPGGLTRNADGPGIFSPSGSWGDPTVATVEKGRVVTEAIVAGIIEQLRGDLGV